MTILQKSLTPKLFALAAPLLVAGSAIGSNLGVGDPAPPIAVAKWVQGDPITTGPGGIRVIEFWATWCGPCKVSIPHLTELAKKYKGQVSFVGVDISEQTATPVPLVKSFVKDMGAKMAYKVAVDGPAGTMGKTWMEAAHQNGIPTAFVVDKTGTVVWIGHPMEGLDEALGQIVSGKYDLTKAKAAFAVAMKGQLEQEKNQEEQAKVQQAEQAAMQALRVQVEKAATDYKAGKKKEALASIDGIKAPNPEIQQQLKVYKFSLMYPDDRVNAKVFADKLIADEKDKPAILTLEFGAAASMRPEATAEDKAYGISMAERALKIDPTDPIMEFQVSRFYVDNKQNDKAIALEQDALKNIGKAKPEIQDRLKAAIQDSLAKLQPKKS